MALACDDYQNYIIYGVIGGLFVVSEALGLTKSTKYNSIVHAIVEVITSALRKEDNNGVKVPLSA
jgi:hypothetical protein